MAEAQTVDVPSPPIDHHSIGVSRLRALRKRLRRLDRSTRGLLALGRVGCALAIAYYFGAYAWVVWSRARYPFDLEWMEGGMVDHVRFLLDHGNIYVPPSLEFVPYVYNPLYYVVSAAVTLMTGEGYFALRLVSIAGSLACFALIYLLVSRETHDRMMGVLSSGLFAATYALSGGWLDVGRVDSLYVAFCLAAIYLVRFAKSGGELVAAAACVWLAFETKQSGIALLLPLALYLLIFVGRKQVLWFLIPAVALTAGSIAILNAISRGWYWFYAFVLTGQLASHYGREVWRSEVFGNFPVALALGFYYLASPRALTSLRAKAYHGLVALSLLAIAAAVRAHDGSWLNDNITAHAALAVLCGLGAHALLKSGSPRRRRRAGAFVYAALLAQFVFLYYDPRQWVPTEADRAEGQRLVEMLRASPGPVLLTHRGYLARREGKGSFAHRQAVANLLLAPGDARDASAKLARDFTRALKEKRFSAVISDFNDFPFVNELERWYEPAPAEFVRDPGAFWCRTGARLKPQYLYVPK